MIRRRNVPWIQRQARFIIGAIAVVGFILTAYLTLTKLTGGEVVCTADAATSGCGGVLDSAYAYPFDPQGKTGPPLSLFGSLAYLSMTVFALTPLFINPDTNKKLRQNLENWTWWLILAGAFAMSVFSGYLMYVLAFELQTVCYYCIGSALLSLSLLILAILGKEWEDLGTIIFTGLTIALITLVSSVGIYSSVGVTPPEDQAPVVIDGKEVISQPQGQPKPPKGWEITTVSGEAEIALAEHLTSVGVIKYGAYWCPHCYDQKQLFGKEAFSKIKYIECAPDGENSQTDTCRAAGIQSFPTWIIDGKVYSGTQSLEKLAELTKYKGNTNFRYRLP